MSKSFGRKKKEVSRPNSPQVPDNLILRNTVDPYKYASKKKVEAENGKDVPHSQRHAKATHSQDPSFNKEQVQSIQSVPASGYLSVVQTLSLSLTYIYICTHIYTNLTHIYIYAHTYTLMFLISCSAHIINFQFL